MRRKPLPKKKLIPRKSGEETRSKTLYRAFYSKEFREFLGQNKGILDEIWKLAAEFQTGRGFLGGPILRNEVRRELRLKNGFFRYILISPVDTGGYRGKRNVGTFKVKVDDKTFFVKLFRTPGEVKQVKAAKDLSQELKKRHLELEEKFPGLNFKVLNYYFGHPGKPPELPGIIFAEFFEFYSHERVHGMTRANDQATRDLGFTLTKKIDQLSRLLGNKWHLVSHNAVYDKFTKTLTFFDVTYG